MQKDTLQGLNEPEAPEAATHAKLRGSNIRGVTSKGAGKEVHEPVARCQSPREGEVEVELVKQVSSDDVVHRELNTKAETVGGNHAPHAVVLGTQDLSLQHPLLLQLARVVKELVLAIREILPEKHHSGADQGVKGGQGQGKPQRHAEKVRPPVVTKESRGR